jgi:endonuclease/exonuclease/phosphatase family metal-dependent hydrolase
VYQLLRWANVILIFITFLAYLSPYVEPSGLWPIAFLGLTYPWLLLFHVLFIVAWIVLKKLYFLFSIGCILVGWGHFTRFVGIHPFSGAAAGEVVTVMSYNCHNLREDDDDGFKRLDPQTFISFITSFNPDVVCFQEFPWQKKNSKPYLDAITGKTALRHFSQENGGIAVFSKYPITGKGGEYFPNHANGYQYIDVEINGKKIRIYNIHLQTNAISNLADQFPNPGNIQEKETWLGFKGMIGRYRRSAGIRAKQATEIADHIHTSPHPVIVCGDFNDVPLSRTYRTLSQGLQDAFQLKGSGLGTTYAGRLPALRIDYILAGPEFQILDHRIPKQGHSDHYPVLGTLTMIE